VGFDLASQWRKWMAIVIVLHVKVRICLHCW